MGNLIIQKFCYDLDLMFTIFSQSAYSQKPENWYDPP